MENRSLPDKRYPDPPEQFSTSEIQENGLTNDEITCITVTSDDVIWVGTMEGISVFDNGARINSFSDEEMRNTVSHIAEVSSGELCVSIIVGTSLFDD